MNLALLKRLAERFRGPLVVAVAFVALLAWTWRKWPDALVDFGREAYIPWQMSEGAVLYRDLAYFNGPLAPTVNATLFQWFGASFSTLIWANVVWTLLLVALVYRWIAARLGDLAATLASLVFLTGFAFAHLLSIGNYNYIAPYSHDLTHGLCLSIVLVAVVSRFRFSATSGAMSGFLLGLIFLTKGEVFLAAAVTVAVASVVAGLVERATRREQLRYAAAFLLASLVAPVAMWVHLAAQMPAGDALLGVVGTWQWIFCSDVTELYRPMAGLDAPLGRLMLMGQAVVASLSILLALVLFDRARADSAPSTSSASSRWARHWPKLCWLAIGLCLGLAALIRQRGFPLLIEAGPLLFASLAMTFGYALAAWRSRRDATECRRLAGLACWALFGLLLLAKVLLAPRISHYGFVLAMPTTLLAVATLVAVLPSRLCAPWRGGREFRRAVIGLILADALGFVLMSSANVTHKTLSLGRGADRLLTYDATRGPTGPALAELLRELGTLPSDATVAVLPEGVMLNYLSRRPNPTGFVNAMPPELRMYGERAFVSALADKRPDFVVLVDKDVTEYGQGPFGCPGNGAEIMAFVWAHYEPVRTILKTPLCDAGFGIQVLAAKR